MPVKRKVLVGPCSGPVLIVHSERSYSGRNCSGSWHHLVEFKDTYIREVELMSTDRRVNIIQPIINTEIVP